MPEAVSALEDAIDAAAANRFVNGDDQTLAALRAEHFDFRSEAGAAVLVRAAATGPDDLALGLVAEGASTHAPPSRDHYGSPKPAIVAAAGRGRARVVRALIAAGALNGEDADLKNRAFLAAVASLDEATLVEILAVHPDINARDGDGRTALMALQRIDLTPTDPTPDDGARRVVVARRLLALGADATLRDRSGATALHGVLDSELVRLLVKAGAPLETRDDTGSTPLTSAETDEAALALLEAGADPRAVDDTGRTALKTATEKKWVGALAFLAAHGVKP